MLTCFCICFTPWLITCLLSCVSVLVFLAGMRPWCKPNHTRKNGPRSCQPWAFVGVPIIVSSKT